MQTVETMDFTLLDDGAEYPDAPGTVTVGELTLRTSKIDGMELTRLGTVVYALGRSWLTNADFEWAKKTWETYGG